MSRGKASIVPAEHELVARDHDFPLVNLTPSVTLLTDIKENPDGNGGLPSLYKDEINACTIEYEQRTITLF